MRLLHIRGDARTDGPIQISLGDYIVSENQRPPYVILSHRWRDDEVLFADMIANDAAAQAKKGYRKLEASCRIALEHGCQDLWCDTCCINKESSAELSESINTYLDDVEDEPYDAAAFRGSEWFSRGWTLQELIAPHDLHFYSQGWKKLGTKAVWSYSTSIASGVHERVLKNVGTLGEFCVSEKMSWAASRTTTRLEDRAYALMGLFGVNMPPLYGEGPENAFRRLQLEILQTTNDHTLFTWDADYTSGDMLAPSVSHFKNGSDYETVDFNYIRLFRGSQPAEKVGVLAIKQPVNSFVSKNVLVTQSNAQFKPDFTMTNAGLHIQLPMDPLPVIHQPTTISRRPADFTGDLRFAFLACGVKGKNCLVAICLRKLPRHGFLMYARTIFDGHTVHHLNKELYDSYPSITITSFNPIWISKTFQSATWKRMISKSIRRLNFELWYKATSPAVEEYWSRKPKHPQTAQDGIGIRRLQLLGDQDQVPQEFTASRQRVQHYVFGSMSTRAFHHELIILQGAANIAFGIVNGQLLIQFSASPRPSILHGHSAAAVDYRTLFADFAFPTGKQWRCEDSLIYEVPGVEGTFDANWANSPTCSAQYVLFRESDEDLSLRIFMAPLEGWVTKIFRRPVAT